MFSKACMLKKLTELLLLLFLLQWMTKVISYLPLGVMYHSLFRSYMHKLGSQAGDWVKMVDARE